MIICDKCKSTDSVMVVRVDNIGSNGEVVQDGLTYRMDLCINCRIGLGRLLGSFDKSKVSKGHFFVADEGVR